MLVLRIVELKTEMICKLALYALMESSFWLDTIRLGWFIIYFEGSQVIISKYFFLSLKITFVLANSVDPDEMLHYEAFHQGLHCLPKYSFRSH